MDYQPTGYLAQPFEPHDLAAGIICLLADPARRQALGHAARQRAVQLWNPARVAGFYAEVYPSSLEVKQNSVPELVLASPAVPKVL